MTQSRAAPSVREATDADVNAFAVFFREAWLQSGAGAPGFAGATDQVIAELTAPDAVLERLGGPDKRMFLAWEQGEVVGFAANRRVDTTTVELAGIIVLPEAAGRGVGAALVAAAFSSARSDDYRTMIVRTEVSNDRALGFYQAHGFVVGESTVEVVEGTPIVVEELTRKL
jgi:ribosomal protein S18 acetylase RimI-like enzyme